MLEQSRGIPENIISGANKLLSLFDSNGKVFRGHYISKMIGATLSVRVDSNYFTDYYRDDLICFMDLYACKRVWESIFMYINLSAAESIVKENNSYLLRLSDVSSFGEAMQKDLIIQIRLCLHDLFSFLYSSGMLTTLSGDGYIELIFDLSSMSDDMRKLCTIFVMCEMVRH